MNGFNVVYQQV